jgi:hypothetical protein
MTKPKIAIVLKECEFMRRYARLRQRYFFVSQQLCSTIGLARLMMRHVPAGGTPLQSRGELRIDLLRANRYGLTSLGPRDRVPHIRYGC